MFDMDTTKACPVCGEPAPPSLGSKPRIYCSKKCRLRAKDRARRAANPEKYRELRRSRYAANPEKYRELRRSRYAANRDANHEKAYERIRNWRAANPEKVRETRRSWRAANPEKVREQTHAAIKNLTDSYVRSMLAQGTSIKPKEVPQSLIDLKRVQVQITRKLKEFNK